MIKMECLITFKVSEEMKKGIDKDAALKCLSVSSWMRSMVAAAMQDANPRAVGRPRITDAEKAAHTAARQAVAAAAYKQTRIDRGDVIDERTPDQMGPQMQFNEAGDPIDAAGNEIPYEPGV